MGRSGAAGRFAGERATTRAGLSQRCCRWVRSSECLLWCRPPASYQGDIILIACPSMVAVLTGRLRLAFRTVLVDCGGHPDEEQTRVDHAADEAGQHRRDHPVQATARLQQEGEAR